MAHWNLSTLQEVFKFNDRILERRIYTIGPNFLSIKSFRVEIQTLINVLNQIINSPKDKSPKAVGTLEDTNEIFLTET